jgi:hypothetical protein
VVNRENAIANKIDQKNTTHQPLFIFPIGFNKCHKRGYLGGGWISCLPRVAMKKNVNPSTAAVNPLGRLLIAGE